MKESIGEINLMDLKSSLKVRKVILIVLVIYMIFRFLFYSKLMNLNIKEIKDIISLFDLTAGALFTALVYEKVKEHLLITWTYEDLYQNKIKGLEENKTKLKLLESSLSTSNNKSTLLYYVNDYYNYAISNNLYTIYSREKFINLIDNFINKLNSATTIRKRKVTKEELIFELNNLNNDTLETLKYFLLEVKKLNKKYKL